MEDLQNLMACIDEISSQIPDGMYLKMADQMKRVHDHMNGNKSIHDDTFYYSDDDSELDSDDDSDSDYEAHVRDTVERTETQREADERARREVSIQIIRDHLLDYVRSMHQVWVDVQKWEKEVKKVIPLITRMTAARKQQAIKRWCERSRGWRPSGSAGDLIGCGPIVTGSIFWSWKNLMENGLHAIVMEIGTEEEIEKAKRKNMCYDDLSLATLKKLPAFEKKIYDDYKREYNEEIVENRREANAKVREHEESMQRWEMCAKGEERKLRELGARVYDRDRWDAESHDFWVDDINGLLVNGS